jgi:hypothetical protein
MDTIIQKKRGSLNKGDKAYIRANVNTLSIAEIAHVLNRTVAPVERYIYENNLILSEMSKVEEDSTKLRAKLHTKEYWTEIQKQFTTSEIEYFEAVWIQLIMQFREDVLYAEELEIKQYITIEILINRNLSERQRATQDVERIQKLLDVEYAKDINIRDMGLVNSLEAQLSFARTQLPAYAAEYAKLLEKRQNIGKDLKATRDQRIKNIKDAKLSWSTYIRALEDEKLREREGDEMALMKLASEAARKKLSENHTYLDGKVDQPLFNSETAKLNS